MTTSDRKMVGKPASVTFTGVVVDQRRRWLQVVLPDGKRRVWLPREMFEASEPVEVRRVARME